MDFMGVDADTGIQELTEEWLEESMESFYGFVTNHVGGVLTTEDTKNDSRNTTKGIKRETSGYKLK